MKQGADKEARNDNGATALLAAAQYGKMDIFKYLIDAGADKAVKDSSCRTALMLAAEYGMLDIVKYLVEEGAGLVAKDDDGRTMLMLASQWSGKLEVVQYLVEQGADVNDKDKNGSTALMMAVQHSKLDVVKYLHEQGADLEVRDHDGNTPWMLAAECCAQHDVVQYYVEHGVKQEAVNDCSDTRSNLMLHEEGGLEVVAGVAQQRAEKEHDDKTVLLVTQEHNSNGMGSYLAQEARNKEGKTALMIAATKGKMDEVQHLVEHGADHEATDNDGTTALLQAARSGQLDVVQYLAEHGADTWCVDLNGNTLLHHLIGSTKQLKFRMRRTMAVEERILPVAKTLLERGVLLDHNSAGESVPALAKSRRFLRLASMVEEYEHKRRLVSGKTLPGRLNPALS